MEGKVCSKCGEWKELSEYYNRKSTKSGKMAWCKKCDKKKCKQYRATSGYTKKYYEANIEHIKEYREENKEKIKQWFENNKEHIKEYREENKENRKEYFKQRYEKNKKDNIEKIKSIVKIKELKKLPIYGYVYKIENIRTGKVYIGQTIKPLKHRYKTGIVKGWIKERLKYDNQKFKDELIEEDIKVTETLDVAFCQYHLDKLEAYYINKYDSYNNGYNNREGNYNTTDGLKEFNEILAEHNLKFVDGKLIQIKNTHQDR
jgi:hypothetical protein